MKINQKGNFKGKFKLEKAFVAVALIGSISILKGDAISIVDGDRTTSYESSTVPEELEILLKDCKELEEMNRNTANVEVQISARIILLKEELRNFIENSLDVPVILDGELLTYETSSQEKKYIEEEIGITDPKWAKKIGVQLENGKSFYYYTKREIYQFDIDESSLMALVRFINLKRTPTSEEILEVLDCYQKAKATSFGYRTAYLTCIDEKTEIGKNRETTVYTGTVFNNTQYTYRTMDLVDRIYLKIKTDYIARTKSTYAPEEYTLKCVNGKWLIIHEMGATDLLSEEESGLCSAASDVENCLDENGILKNSKDVDFKIETLQYCLEDYLKPEEEKQK